MVAVMEGEQMTDGAGWISDDSDFYGDDDVRRKLGSRVGQNLKSSYSYLQPRNMQCEVTKRPTNVSSANRNPDDPGKCSASVDAINFLKNRPQVSALRKSVMKSARESEQPAAGLDAAELVDNNPHEGVESAWQHHETVADFVKRAPVLNPSTANLGPWLWVSSPRIKPTWRDRNATADVEAFEIDGKRLLHAFRVQQDRVGRSMAQPAPATISRKMGPSRDQLEDDLLALAVKTNATCGKWMLFPPDDDYPHFWRVVAEATAAGRLGPTSKAATYNEVDPLKLICVYTYDFTDRDDVVRVLQELIELGLCAPDGRAIYYKCDAYTYLGISSGNDYKLKPSLYSSRALLGLEEKPKKDGPVDRLQKKSRTIDAFFA